MSVSWENEVRYEAGLPREGVRRTIDCWRDDDEPALLGRLVRFTPLHGPPDPWAMDTALHLSTGLARDSEWGELADAQKAVEEALA